MLPSFFTYKILRFGPRIVFYSFYFLECNSEMIRPDFSTNSIVQNDSSIFFNHPNYLKHFYKYKCVNNRYAKIISLTSTKSSGNDKKTIIIPLTIHS